MTRESGGVWPFPFKTAPRKGFARMRVPHRTSRSLKACGYPERIFMKEVTH